jgi:hypothetical protein
VYWVDYGGQLTLRRVLSYVCPECFPVDTLMHVAPAYSSHPPFPPPCPFRSACVRTWTLECMRSYGYAGECGLCAFARGACTALFTRTLSMCALRWCSCGEEYRELSWASHPWVLRDAVTSESLLVCCGPGAAASEISCMAYWTSGVCGGCGVGGWEGGCV